MARSCDVLPSLLEDSWYSVRCGEEDWTMTTTAQRDRANVLITASIHGSVDIREEVNMDGREEVNAGKRRVVFAYAALGCAIPGLWCRC